MKVILTGASGQLGKTLANSKPKGVDLIQLTRNELNLENSEECFNIIKYYQPDWVLNTAAYTSVDLAESQIEKAYKINYEAPKQFSEALSLYEGRLLHISTDFVFNGNTSSPYQPNDKVDAINIYGKSKAAGEKIIQEILGDKALSTIIRTSWLMSPFGDNFALTMLKLMHRKEVISVVNDQFGSPTSCESLARTCWQIIILKSQNKIHCLPEIFHWSNLGKASWYDVAILIWNISKELNFPLMTSKINKVSSKRYPTKAKRPNYSVLDSTATSEFLNIKNICWKDAIKVILNDPSLKRIY